MSNPRVATRLFVVGACLALTSTFLSVTLRSEPSVPRTSLADFPGRLGEWSGLPAETFDAAVVKVLGVDEYVNRYYASGMRLAHLYVGYYGTQREGDAIHSPMNCLPGAGWLPVETGTIDLRPGGIPIRVNRYIIQQGLDKQVVLYWYQSHGRTIASDYWSKVYLVLDSIRLHRTDAALVRVIAPFDEASAAPERRAEEAAISFVDAMYPQLSRFLPD
jgi:EpsI family protein